MAKHASGQNNSLNNFHNGSLESIRTPLHRIWKTNYLPIPNGIFVPNINLVPNVNHYNSHQSFKCQIDTVNNLFWSNVKGFFIESEKNKDYYFWFKLSNLFFGQFECSFPWIFICFTDFIKTAIFEHILNQVIRKPLGGSLTAGLSV